MATIYFANDRADAILNKEENLSKNLFKQLIESGDLIPLDSIEPTDEPNTFKYNIAE